jgi:hypothetical protein
MKVILNACLEKMEANPGELQSVEVLLEVLKEDAAMETTVALKERHGDRHLTVDRR